MAHVSTAGLEAGIHPEVRRIGLNDIGIALRRGLDDFMANRSDIVFVGLIYPAAGVLLFAATFGASLLPLLFPLVAGFTLMGPLAAVGFYEMSRRREMGQDYSWSHSFALPRHPAFPSILAMGWLLAVTFFLWLGVAWCVYRLTLHEIPPESLGAFMDEVLTTREGWTMMVLGNLVGACFAAFVLTVSVVTFPMLLDRNCGLAAAVSTSVRAASANRRMMVVWGAVVAIGLFLGALPFLLGLALVVPVLGHASWHLYRRLVAPA